MELILFLLAISSVAEKIVAEDFLTSIPVYGTRAVGSREINSISFYSFSGALTFDTYQSNIRLTQIETVDPIFISTYAPQSDYFPPSRIFYGMFKVDDKIFIYGGLGPEDIKGDMWVYKYNEEMWYDWSEKLVYYDTGRRFDGRYDFASTSFIDGNYSDFILLGGTSVENSSLPECLDISIHRKNGTLDIYDCLDYTGCTGMSLSGAQVQYYEGKLYLFSGINLEKEEPRYFTGLCVIDYLNWTETTQWEKVEIVGQLVGSHRGGSVLYNEQLIYYFGSSYNGTEKVYNPDVYSLNLSAPKKGWSKIFSSSVGCDSFSHTLHNDTVFALGGLCSQENILTKLDLLNKKAEPFFVKTPSHRIGSSLTRSSSELYLFAGQSQLFYHSGIWQYSPKSNESESKWVEFQDIILEPSRRKYSASTSQGLYTLIAGGVSPSGGFLKDFWILNTKSKSWIELVPNRDSPRPSDFAYACLVLKVPYFYLLGGLSNERKPMNEIWRYDLSKDEMVKLKNLSEEFPERYEFGCQYEKSKQVVNGKKVKRQSIYTYFGKNDRLGSPECAIGRVDLEGDGYFYQDLARSPRMPCRSSAAYHYEKNKLVIVGGQGVTGEALSDIWVLGLNNTHVISEVKHNNSLIQPVYGSSYESFNQNLFLISGFELNGNSGPERATDIIYKVDYNEILNPALCDLGFELRNGKCQKCPKGSFSSKIGGECEKCLPEGVTTEHEGSTAGVECIINLGYLPDSKLQQIEDYLGHNSVKDSGEFIYQAPNLMIFYIVFGSIMLVFICIFLCIFFAIKDCGMFFIERSLLDDTAEKKELEIPDAVELREPLLKDGQLQDSVIREMARKAIKDRKKKKEISVARKIKKKLIKRHTPTDLLKGLLTGLIVLTLLAILIYLPVDYVTTNIKEKIELIPTVAFRKQFENLNNSLTVHVVTYPFNHGDCSVDLTHSELVTTEDSDHVIYSNPTNKSGGFACHIHIKVNKSDIYENDFISINFRKNNIYAKNILVWAEAGTAKPGFNSRYFQELVSDQEKSFDGRTPSVFQFLIVPAYYQEEGYFLHSYSNSGMTISSNTRPDYGSEIDDSHLQLGSSLSLQIALVSSESSMLTTVYLETGLIEFIITLGAQLLGILGIFEGIYIIVLYLIMKLRIAKKEEELIHVHYSEHSEGEEEKKEQ